MIGYIISTTAKMNTIAKAIKKIMNPTAKYGRNFSFFLDLLIIIFPFLVTIFLDFIFSIHLNAEITFLFK